MKLTLNWLKDYLDTEKDAQEIAEKMTAIGLEVEEVINQADLFKEYKVGYVCKAEKHPNADRLKVCEVDVGQKETMQIVCGAPNAREGIKVAFAPVGSYIPGIDVTLKKASIRGVESNGMMCSERELCLSDEHNGIIELPCEAQVGQPLAPALGLNDPIIDVSITPNRGDCAGVYGIARDLSAAGIGQLKVLNEEVIQPDFQTDITVSIQNKQACPVFLGRLIQNVKNGQSPQWLQDRLKAIGLRPISVLVDITNYFCIGLNRPLHVFDADKLKGNLVIRDSKEGESFKALNDKSYTLESGMTVVCDDTGVLGLGGIIGGEDTGCDENTTNVYLECAYFDPIITACTGRKLQINSDSRYRFERGVDPLFVQQGMELSTKMILDLCGGKPGTVQSAGKVPDITKTYDFDLYQTEKLTGVVIDPDQQLSILDKLGFKTVLKQKTVYQVTTPSWRHDIEGIADLVEEILRIYGYDKIHSVSVAKNQSIKKPALDTVQSFLARSKRCLASRGLQETVTWSFIDQEQSRLFGFSAQQEKELSLLNPMSQEMSTMRPSILPNLIEAAARNQAKGFGNAALFEVGPVFSSLSLETGQQNVITGLRAGDAQPKHWTNNNRVYDVMDVKADVLALLALSGANLTPQITSNAPDYYHPGRSGVFQLGKNVLANFGEIYPAVCSAFNVKETLLGFELFVERLPLKARKNKGYTKETLVFSAFQPIRRDFAFVVSVDVAAEDCVRTILSVDKKLINSVDVFDVYQGKGIKEGQKSLALSVNLQPYEKTLTDEDLEEISRRIVQAVSEKTGATLRE